MPIDDGFMEGIQEDIMCQNVDYKVLWKVHKDKYKEVIHSTYVEAYKETLGFLDLYLNSTTEAQGVWDIAERLIHEGPKEYPNPSDYFKEIFGWVEWVVYKLKGVDLGECEEMIEKVWEENDMFPMLRIKGNEIYFSDGMGVDEDDYIDSPEQSFDLRSERCEEDE